MEQTLEEKEAIDSLADAPRTPKNMISPGSAPEPSAEPISAPGSAICYGGPLPPGTESLALTAKPALAVIVNVEMLDVTLPANFPEGGLDAWSCVLGGWCAMFAAFGLANCLGVFLTYYVEGPLASYGSSTVSWIITVQLYFQSGSAVFWGRLYDIYGPRWLMYGGSILYIFGLLMTSLGTKYYQIFLAQSLVAALGSGAIFNVSMTCATTWFHKRRAAAMGILVSGSSLGGVVLPITFDHLIPRLGFPWALRIVALILLALCCVSCLTVKSRLPPRPKALKVGDYARPLTEPAFLYTVLTGFFFLMGMFIPTNYVTLQAEAEGVSPRIVPYLLPIINGVGIFGRIIPGFVADVVGRYNTMTVISALSAIFTLALWIPGRGAATLVVYGAVFGFTSGGYVSLGAPCIAQISDMREIGTRTGTAYLLQALGGLIGSPIAGALVARMDGRYLGLQVFCGISMCFGVAFNLAARYAQVGFRVAKV